jgi:FkbM family methyltransferase
MKIKTVLGDAVDNLIFVHGMYEEATSRVIKALSGECKDFIDVGCNIGYYSCLYGITNQSGKLYCIDPNPDMIRRTEENLILNGIKDYELLPIAAGPQACKMKLNIAKDRHSLSSLAYVPKQDKWVDHTTIEVDVCPLSELIEKYQIRDTLLKVDAEGFEYQVFCGLTETALKAIKYLIFELSAANLELAGTSTTSLLSFSWMKQFDFFRIVDESQAIVKELPETIVANHTSANILLVSKGLCLPSQLKVI